MSAKPVTVRELVKPKWFRLLSRPVQLLVEDRVKSAGFDADADAWIAGIMTTAMLSPQGYVLRLSMKRETAKVLSAEATADADLFSPSTSGF